MERDMSRDKRVYHNVTRTNKDRRTGWREGSEGGDVVTNRVQIIKCKSKSTWTSDMELSSSGGEAVLLHMSIRGQQTLILTVRPLRRRRPPGTDGRKGPDSNKS
ncbi:hypothetical protein F2P81_024491 [Scophthalmus maximus]|uniref:Uncharacterized protein n=1 Tax=Scophthalmus maximus TaxID=52904 RepID=A0A6A4RXR5_SCOMX|nr:hypothetical protein F2P81_024491 [Scophthalmus maximus]